MEPSAAIGSRWRSSHVTGKDVESSDDLDSVPREHSDRSAVIRPAAYTRRVRKRRQIASYDVLRVGATLGVVAIHVAHVSLQLSESSPRWLEDLEWFLNLFMVPTFFFVSGALVWTHYNRRGVRGWFSFLGRRARIVLIPYLGWSAFYLLAIGEGAVGLRNWLGLLVTGDAYYHLYFVPILMVFYLVTPLAKRFLDWSPVLLLAVAFLLDFGALSLLNGGFSRSPYELEILLGRASLFVPYIAIGAVFGSRKTFRDWCGRLWPLLLCLAVVGSYWQLPSLGDAGTRTWTSFTVSAGLLGAAGLVGRLNDQSKVAHIAERLVPATYLVYLIHPLVLGLLKSLILKTDLALDWSNPIVFAVFWGVVVAVSFAGVDWWHRIRREWRERSGESQPGENATSEMD